MITIGNFAFIVAGSVVKGAVIMRLWLVYLLFKKAGWIGWAIELCYLDHNDEHRVLKQAYCTN